MGMSISSPTAARDYRQERRLWVDFGDWSLASHGRVEKHGMDWQGGIGPEKRDHLLERYHFMHL